MGGAADFGGACTETRLQAHDTLNLRSKYMLKLLCIYLFSRSDVFA
jgi:hypothetical protein